MPTPELPEELWFHIFLLAASEPPSQFDPGALHPDFYEGRSDFGSTLRGEEVNARYLQRQTTRCCLNLVSRKWRRLALPILFEYVLLLSMEGVRSFSEALRNDWQRLSQHEQLDTSAPDTIGRYTRYLNVHLRDFNSCALLTPYDAQLIVQSFRFCINVVIVSIYEDPGITFGSLVKACILTTARRLLCINIPDISFTVHPFIECGGTLEVLHIYATGTLDLPDFVLPRLHTLELSRITFRSAAGWSLPLLRRVRVLGGYQGRWTGQLTPFFQAHGAKIRIFDATRLGATDIDLITQYFTSLIEIIIPVRLFHSVEPLLQRLEHLGITVQFELPDKRVMMREMTRVMDVLFEHWVKESANSIRLVGWDLASFWDWSWTVEELEIWKRWIEKARVEGIRFTFDYGNVVMLPLKLEAGVYYPRRSDYAELVSETNQAIYGDVQWSSVDPN
jgi:hypothetical protein